MNLGFLRRFGGFAPLAALLFASCSSVNVATDYREDVDFFAYRTFDWMKGPQGLQSSMRVGPTMDNRIKRAIEAELIAKGLQRSLGGRRPDLLVVYHTAMNADIDRTYYDVWGYGRRGRWRHGTVVVVDRQARGTMVIDLVDRRDNELVWRGTATGVVSSRSEARKRVFEAVARILEAYPPS
jgi:hypothetical protein